MPLRDPPHVPHRVPGKAIDRREDTDLREYFDTFEMVMEYAREMLIDEALSENLSRPHHLESAISSLQTAAQLDEVRKIVHDLYLGEDSDPVQGNEHPQDF